MKQTIPVLVMLLAKSAAAQQDGGHPQLPGDDRWAWVVVAVIGVMFLLAMVIGPVVRAFSPPVAGPAPTDELSHMPQSHGH